MHTFLFFILFFLSQVHFNMNPSENNRKNALMFAFGGGLASGIILTKILKYLVEEKNKEQEKKKITFITSQAETITSNVNLPEAYSPEIKLEKVFIEENIKEEILINAKKIFDKKINEPQDISENIIALYGQNGTLKTTLIEGIANAVNVPLLLIDEKFLNNQTYESLSLEMIFQKCQRIGPCIIHIKNVQNMHKNFFSSFIKYLEGFYSPFPILLTFSTNSEHFAHELKINKKKDIAFYVIEKPKYDMRKKIIEEILEEIIKKNKNIEFKDIDIEKLAHTFNNLSPLDIFLIFSKTLRSIKIKEALQPEEKKIITITTKNIIEELKKYKRHETLIQSHNQKNNLHKMEEFLVEESHVTFDNVIGSSHIKKEIQFVVDFLRHPQKYKDINVRLPKGFLFSGPPGCGKTMLARAIAHEAGVSMFVINASEVIHKYVGEGAATIRKIFEFARAHAPAIIFIDEIDAIASKRSDGGDGEREKDRTLNQLLTEIDGFNNTQSEVIVIGATNRSEILDPALTRSKRLEKHFSFSLPTLSERKEIISFYVKNKNEEKENMDIDENIINKLAYQTSGLSGADLELIINNAKIIAINRDFAEKKITESDIHKAYSDFTIGIELENITITDAQIKKTAFHEIGHTLMMLLQRDYPYEFDTVTIVPRDQGDGSVVLGFARYFKKVDLQTLSKENLKKVIIALLGGYMAEHVFYHGNIDDGAVSDLKRATSIAQKMVKSFGMGTKLFSSSDKLTEKEQEEVELILQECKEQCKKILDQNSTILSVLAEILIDKKTLTKSEITEILKNHDHQE
jgi:cell division protease FtsH